MVRVFTGPFTNVVRQLLGAFDGTAEPVDVGQWQSLDIKGDASKVTWELREAVLAFKMNESIDGAQREYLPNLPWAEDHFRERVSGKPLNPPPSQAWWPFAQAGHEKHIDQQGRFSHTYPERFWPKWAEGGEAYAPDHADYKVARRGIRFEYGDFNDVVNRLEQNPLTRQAYLPIWFPEDTGAPAGERVPCTLGYLFMIRNGKLHVTYHIRSCDFMRHWRDDVYMAVRLAQEVAFLISHSVELGDLTMHIGSFHIFEGDRNMVRYLHRQADISANERLMENMGC